MPPTAALTTADASSTLGGWLIIALLAPGMLILVGMVVMFILSRRKPDADTHPAPGYYHVMGIDRDTGKAREATFHANTRQSARGRAEMDGIIVTEIRQVDESA